MPASSFFSGNQAFFLSPHEVHVWVISQPASPSGRAAAEEKYARLLSPDESTKAAAFKFEKDKIQSIVSRGVLRSLLSSYLGTDPQAIRFNYNPAGKPWLPELGFNVSHSQSRILIAVAREQELGIDIEFKKALSDLDSMVRLVLSEREKMEFDTLVPGLRLALFYEYWSRKEAYLKAIGKGLGCSLKEAEFTLLQGNSLELARVAEDELLSQTWSVFPLAIDSDYAAALFIRGKGWQVVINEWPL